MKKALPQWLNRQNKESAPLSKSSWKISDTHKIGNYEAMLFSNVFSLNKKTAMISPRRPMNRNKIYTEDQADSLLEAMYIESINNS